MGMFDIENGVCTDRVACQKQAPLRSAILQMYKEVSRRSDISNHFKVFPQNIKYGDTVWSFTTDGHEEFRWIFEEACQDNQVYRFILVHDNVSTGCGFFSWLMGSKEEIVIPLVRLSITTSAGELAPGLLQSTLLQYLCELAENCDICEGAFQTMADGGYVD